MGEDDLPPGLSDGIDPSAITIPPVRPDDVEEAGRALKGAGGDILDLGEDIKAGWNGLRGIYSAPEAETLLSAVDEVPGWGEEVNDAATTAGDALIQFAADVRPILERWRGLKADAVAMQAHIQGNDDWRKDEDKVEEFNTLNNDLIKVQNDYMRPNAPAPTPSPPCSTAPGSWPPTPAPSPASAPTRSPTATPGPRRTWRHRGRSPRSTTRPGTWTSARPWWT
ncbi:hypothetical protein ACFPZ0_03105 [Streptomonospora nanhaiensis]|uniref:Uncharacterized protein n=1 Tax=Streptomonospora nanhaiensis TaxID=1323731 RepID=A0A853BU14_9ACTN|nr:hypothetical protein [Streptomonospora nanhaiensis]NYI98454.1 hypothetical protein [Streptomonospora nanhaiensis]